MVAENIIGTITSDGCVVVKVYPHLQDRLDDRDISSADVMDALQNPLHITDDRTGTATGEVSRQYIGQYATVAYNPNNRSAVTAWRTGSRYIKKYGGDS